MHKIGNIVLLLIYIWAFIPCLHYVINWKLNCMRELKFKVSDFIGLVHFL